ncbi:MAG: DUF1697 domain-containing protein [Bacteroidales bacterium]
MPTYIAILRGINVSGHKLIKMKALQEMFEHLGFSRVRTYIQSGNVAFESTLEETEKLEKIISDGIQEHFSFVVPVIVLTGIELRHISENNKFVADRGEDQTKLHVTILSAAPQGNLIEAIPAKDFLPDEYYVTGKTVYLFCPQGYGNTKLSNNFFEKKLKVQATTRNWKTILELVKLSD